MTLAPPSSLPRSRTTERGRAPRFPAGGSPYPVAFDARSEPPASTPPIATPYHRLPRTLPRWAWWRMLLALVVAAAIWFAAQTALIFAVLAGQGGASLEALEDLLNRMLALDAVDLPAMLLGLGSLALMLPSLLVGLWLLGLRPSGVLSSVRYRLRWGLLWWCVPWAVLALVVSLGVSLALLPLAGEELAPVWTPWNKLAPALVLIVLLVPFQAAAEEYVFRGALVQALGSWLPRASWATAVVAAVATLAFVAGHGYEVWGLADVGIFGLAALWLTLRTGGLEAAIALHVVNNVLVFALLATGALGSTAQSASGGDLVGLLLSAVTTIAYCWIVGARVRRRGLATHSPWQEQGGTAPLALPVPIGGPGGLAPQAVVLASPGPIDLDPPRYPEQPPRQR